MTRDCTSIQRALAVHRPDQPLPEPLADHLAGCAGCREIFDRDAALWPLLLDYSAPDPSPGLVDAVAARVAGESPARATATASWRAFAAAAALVIAAGAGLGGWLGSQTGPSAAAANPAPATLADHAEVLGAAPPGSLSSAYASLEAGEVEP